MKKKLLSLLFIPTLLLCSCKGAKITEDKAKELAAKIVANEDALEGKGTEINATLKDNKNNVTYQLITDKNENVKFKAKGKADDESLDFVIYTVKNEEHEEVSYIKSYNHETKTYSEHVYSKKETTGYSALVSPYSMQALAPLLMVAGFADPVKIMTYNNKTEYFSTGERNLTIEITQKYVSGEPIVEEGEEVDDEYPKDMKLTITYDNLVLKSVNATVKSSKGNTGSIKTTVNINNSLKVELPKNWKDLLNK